MTTKDSDDFINFPSLTPKSPSTGLSTIGSDLTDLIQRAPSRSDSRTESRSERSQSRASKSQKEESVFDRLTAPSTLRSASPTTRLKQQENRLAGMTFLPRGTHVEEVTGYVRRLEKKIASREVKILTLEDRIAEIEVQKKELQEKISVLERDVAEEATKCRVVVQQNKKLAAVIDENAESMSKLKRELDALTVIRRDQNKQITTLQERAKDLERQCEIEREVRVTTGARAAKIEENAQRMESKINFLQSELNRMNALREGDDRSFQDRFDRKKAEWESTKEAMNETVTDLRNQVKELKNSLESTEKRLLNANMTLRDRDKELTGTQNLLRRSEKDRQSVEAKLTASKAHHDDVIRKVKELWASETQRRETLEQVLAADNAAKDREIRTLHSKLHATGGEKEQTELELRKLMGKHLELMETMDAVQQSKVDETVGMLSRTSLSS